MIYFFLASRFFCTTVTFVGDEILTSSEAFVDGLREGGTAWRKREKKSPWKHLRSRIFQEMEES